MIKNNKNILGPLQSGNTIVVIGGGPGGASCAIALKNLALMDGKQLQVILYEGKIFEKGTHHNQCAGVLSPPIVEILETNLQVKFPWHLVQKEITGYILHSTNEKIHLSEESDPTYAVRRVTFDDYLLNQARERGVEVIQSRVTDVEIFSDRIMVYSESENTSADVIVGAFGLDDGTAKIFERATQYRQPRFLSSIVTKIHPSKKFMEQFGNEIHAFLPPFSKLEFGAVTPKKNHLTINIAGLDINSDLMDKFINYSPVSKILPTDLNPEKNQLMYFKGRFPFRVSKGFYGNRYVVVGDAAGLLRPFKGKGVNTSMITALSAAKTIMRDGISRKAFKLHYRTSCHEIIADIPYGKVLRWLAIYISGSRLFESIIKLAKNDILLRKALFNSISAHKPFKQIFKETLKPKLVLKFIQQLFK